MTPRRSRHIVLAGTGHAHLYTLARAAELKRLGHRLTVVGPQPFWYSGLATGMLGGGYAPTDDQLEPARMLAGQDVQLIDSIITRVDSARRRLDLRDGSSAPYEVLSLNVGSEVEPLPTLSDSTS